MVHTPTYLYDSISPTLITSMISGTLPFHLIYDNGKHKLETNRTAKYISMTYILFFTVFLIHACINPNNLIILNYYNSVVSNLGLIFELIGGVVLTYMIYIYNLVCSESICDVFLRCNQVDLSLMQFNCDFRYRYIYYYQCVHICSGVTTFLFTGVIQYFNSTAAGFGSLTFSLRIVLLGPLLIIFFMETQYSCLALIIRFRFEAINKELSLLEENNKISLAKNIGPITVSRGLASKTSEYATPSPLQRIEALMIIHDALSDIVDRINFNYGLQILISIGLKFIISVFSIYYCYWSQVVKGRMWSSIIWFSWAVYNLYELINLSISCQKATSVARYTATHVHKLLLYTSNAALREKLCIFSQQLIHRHVIFSAMELFPIDATLFLAIISTGSTYLIIMLQFQESTDGKKHTTIMLNSSLALEV